MRDMLNFTSIQALNALRTRQAQQYHAEFEARVEILEDTTQPDAVLQPYSVRPRVLFFDDATPYADNWRNEAPAGLLRQTLRCGAAAVRRRL